MSISNINNNMLLNSKVLLKKFSLQNLSFISNSKTNFVKKTVLFNANILNNNALLPYYNLIFCFLQSSNQINSNFLKLYFLNNNFFVLKNIKIFNFVFLNNSLQFYLCGLDSADFTSRSYSLFNKFFRQLSSYTEVFFSSWMSNIFFIGVGYKVFIFNNYLYLRLGFSRMLKILIPTTVTVMTRKRNHLRIISSSHEQLESFLYLLKNLRVFDCYKGKGIFQTSDFSTIKLKVGKKQQFF